MSRKRFKEMRQAHLRWSTDVSMSKGEKTQKEEKHKQENWKEPQVQPKRDSAIFKSTDHSSGRRIGG